MFVLFGDFNPTQPTSHLTNLTHYKYQSFNIVPNVMAVTGDCANVESSRVPVLTPDAVIEPLSKAEERRAHKLGRMKMKRDRIIQEINKTGLDKNELQQMLTDVEKRISTLQGVAVRRPTAKQVGVLCI